VDEKVNNMKVEGKQTKFEPVVITIESQDELIYLWHCLSLFKSDVKEYWDRDFPFPKNVDDNQMFQSLDKIVKPENY
jgi:hypothetical protein